jgi:hypothetical protein
MTRHPLTGQVFGLLGVVAITACGVTSSESSSSSDPNDAYSPECTENCLDAEGNPRPPGSSSSGGSSGANPISGGGINGQKDGDETDVDCGGEAAPKCGEGKTCNDDDDCEVACSYAKKCIGVKSCKPHLGENPGLYAIKGEIPDDKDYTVPFGKCAVRNEGKDITLIGYSRMALVAMEVAEELDKDGISAEVIDVRSLLPLDTETIFESVRKTHRAVVIYEDWKSGGFGSEIVARIQESCFDDLDAPVGRIGGLNVPMPYARNLELLCIPNKEDLLKQVRATLG